MSEKVTLFTKFRVAFVNKHDYEQRPEVYHKFIKDNSAAIVLSTDELECDYVTVGVFKCDNGFYGDYYEERPVIHFKNTSLTANLPPSNLLAVHSISKQLCCTIL